MADDINDKKAEQSKRKTAESVARSVREKTQREVPKACPSCQKPRWDKTARNT
ncbi:hypothetical protein DEALK_07590 [Dehalogenimonas alkenigignens]|uniref:Uncharacterized protein n=1 Tax=Dehalogenimonas alkenigignens TaxID=1217799 RepID=A0A0W0GH74_9CHLR|nr:hypothetical protein [Dehalogenimonas alkenigignens]KTB47914.1 hypothetical protein DEALK_07590 [Dehalogenimonas alkenigignens]